jgi:hypothetical protein
MAQGPTKAPAEPTRAAERADEAERDRVAWNLPLSADDEASRRADRAKPDSTVDPPKRDERRR